MSPTYLSKIERGAFPPPSEEKVKAIAKQLGQNEDEFLALAGRVPSDIAEIIRKQPREIAAFLRSAKDLPQSGINVLTQQALKIRRKNLGTVGKNKEYEADK